MMLNNPDEDDNVRMDDDNIRDTPLQGESSKMLGILGRSLHLKKGVSSVSLAMDDIDEELPILNS